MWTFWNLDNLIEMTCAIWSLGQIPASLTVHWLKGIAISVLCSLKSACQLANKLKITGVSFYRSLCSEPSPCTPCRADFAASNPCTLCSLSLLGHWKWGRIKQKNLSVCDANMRANRQVEPLCCQISWAQCWRGGRHLLRKP